MHYITTGLGILIDDRLCRIANERLSSRGRGFADSIRVDVERGLNIEVNWRQPKFKRIVQGRPIGASKVFFGESWQQRAALGSTRLCLLAKRCGLDEF